MAIREAIQSGLVGDVRRIEIEHGGSFHWPAHPAVTFKKQMAGCFSTWEFTIWI